MQDQSITIPLTKGQVAIIDAEDFASVRLYTWRAHKCRHVWYAYTNVRREGVSRTLSMHQLILGIKPGLLIDHENGDGLDNRRQNLSHVTHSANGKNRHFWRDKRKGGVYWYEERGKYVARYRRDGKNVWVGSFATYDDAEAALLAATAA